VDTTTNEYLHENFTMDNDDGTFTVYYEVPENRGVLSLQGCIYRRGKGSNGRLRESHPFWWHREGGTQMFFDAERNKKPKAIRTHFVGRGRDLPPLLKIVWDANPGDHFLCVSYAFDDREPDPVDKAQRINWLKEGF